MAAAQNSRVLNVIMKIVALFLMFTTFYAQAEGLVCNFRDGWPHSRNFQAELSLEQNGNNYKATIAKLHLSHDWPLSEACDSPFVGQELTGHREGGELKLGPIGSNECGYIFFITNSEGISLLSPRKTYKVFGEKPYKATCQKI